jgi:hypothetical protein
MKTSCTLVLLIFTMISHGQNFNLFSSSDKKLFSTYPTPHFTYSLAFDTVLFSSGDSVYYNFSGVDNAQFLSDSCLFWGGPACFKQNVPSWLGKKVVHNNAARYRFYNLAGDTLGLNFAVTPADTVLIFKDAIQKFSILYQKTDTTTIISVIDSVRYYRILHTDLGGNPINSPLNQFHLVVSRNHGLVRYFQVDSFPQVLKPLAIAGSLSPPMGLHELTQGMLYDYLPGDEIQYFENGYHFGGPPVNNYSRYRKLVITSKTLSPDSVIYDATQQTFESGSSQVVTSAIILKYHRNTVIALFPFEKFDGSTRSLILKNYCNQKYWTYATSTNNSLTYCSTDTCWGPFDTGGPPLKSERVYTAGLGIQYASNSVTAPMPVGYSNSSQIVYFKKNGLPCGTEVPAGIPEPKSPGTALKVFPNPVSNYLFIENEFAGPKPAYLVYNSTGQVVALGTLLGNSISVAHLSKGFYGVRIVSEKNSLAAKFIKQ